MNRNKIVVIEDEPDIVEVVSSNLKREGYNVLSVERGDEGLNLIRNQSPNLVILDLMLPGMDGLSICQQMKSDPLVRDIPVIIISAKGEESDVVIGLELGADDYLTKPFSPRELVARVDSQFRRVEMDAGPPETLEFPGNIKVDLARLEVHRDGKLDALTPREADILKYLIRHRDRVVTRGDLLLDVWHYQSANVETRTVDIHIVGLRRKIEPDPAEPSLIQTVRGKGYRWHDSD